MKVLLHGGALTRLNPELESGRSVLRRKADGERF